MFSKILRAKHPGQAGAIFHPTRYAFVKYAGLVLTQQAPTPTMPSALLDYRLGWRWLLPYVPGQKLYLRGFNEAEQAFWHKAVASAEWVRSPNMAEGWLIDTSGTASVSIESFMAAMPEAVQWVVFTGTGGTVYRWRQRLPYEFKTIHEYGLLPAANPRLIIPLAKPDHVVAALALHSPGRWAAQVAVRLAVMLARVGMFFPLRRQVLLIAERSPSLGPMGALQARMTFHVADEGTDYALYLGTSNDNRKTVALPLGVSTPDVVTKMGESAQARQALKNEAATLKFLAKSSTLPYSSERRGNGHAGSLSQGGPLLDHSLADQVPRMMGLVENEHGVALYQEYRPRLKARPAVLEEAVIDFLAQLSMINRRSCPLQEVLNMMADATGPVGFVEGDDSSLSSIWRWLYMRAEQGAVVYKHRTHGDFAPWNCAWTAQGFFVFDWEESHPLALAFGDAFYFAIAPALHVTDTDPKWVLRKALAIALQVAERSRFTDVDVNLHFTVWLLSRLKSHPLLRPILNVFKHDLFHPQ